MQDRNWEIGSIRAERSSIPLVSDRMIFLFANTPRGAKASAIIFSILETMKENHANPYAYLRDILKNAPNWDIHKDAETLQQLLPHFTPSECRMTAVTN